MMRQKKSKIPETELQTERTHLVSETGERGPRLDVVLAMFERMLEYEEEVARGERIPQYVMKDGKLVALGAALPRQKKSAVCAEETL